MNGNRKTRAILICALAVMGGFLATGTDTKADFVFGPAQNAGPAINTSQTEIQPIPEHLSLWFDRRSGPDGAWEYWRATRYTEDSPWETAVNFGKWEESDWNLVKVSPSYTTADGLEVYFWSEASRPGGYGQKDLWMKKREKIEDDWGPAVNLGPKVNSAHDEVCPSVSPNGLELYFSGWGEDARPGGYGKADLWVTRRNTRGGPWGEPENLGPTVNTASFDARPFLLANGLLLFFESDRPGGFGSADLYMMRRTTAADPWTEPMNLGPRVNSPASDENGFLSPDGSTLYFHSDRAGGYGGYDIWQVPIIPIVDSNGDGKVDGREVLIMAARWGQSDSLLDIGPYAWGDGVVDIQDVAALAEYIGKDIYDPTLIAHWKLDETEGMVVADSVGDNNGYAIGEPIWLPDGGQVDGALEFDGVDDFISDPAVLNPEDSPFSVLLWIKGGEPGQAIISEPGGSNWLSIDSQTGCLMTELTEAGRSGGPLLSDAIIADGTWHRVGLVWDGSNRMLYVDGVTVAEDQQNGLSSPGSGLYIGTGKNMESGTFFSGLIDDVRVYNRAVKP